MIRINLLPVRAAKKKETIRQQVSIAGLSVVLLFIILGVLYFSVAKKIGELKNSIASEENTVSQLEKEIGELKNVENENKAISDKLKIVKQLEVNKKQHLKLFADIANSISEKLWIDSLKETGQNITIVGFAGGDDIVADFIRRLEKNLAPWKVELEVVNQVEKEKQKVAGFTIKVEKPKEAAPPTPAKPKT